MSDPKCSSCGAEIKGEHKFCVNCGTQLTKVTKKTIIKSCKYPHPHGKLQCSDCHKKQFCPECLFQAFYIISSYTRYSDVPITMQTGPNTATFTRMPYTERETGHKPLCPDCFIKYAQKKKYNKKPHLFSYHIGCGRIGWYMIIIGIILSLFGGILIFGTMFFVALFFFIIGYFNEYTKEAKIMYQNFLLASDKVNLKS